MEIERSTDFLFGTAYVENLIPRRYNITVSKEGYYSWNKSLEIGEKRVTEMKNVVLLPTDPLFSIIGRKYLDIFPLPYHNKIALKESINGDGWQILIHDPSRNTIEPLISHEDLLIDGYPVDILSFSQTRKIIIDAGLFHIVIDPENPESHYIVEKVKNPKFNPRDDNFIIYLDNGSLISLNYAEKTSLILAEEIEAFDTRPDGSLFWLSSKGTIFQNEEIVRNISFPIIEENRYEIYLPNQSRISIKENDYFYFFKDNKFVEMFHSPRNPVVSPDLKKLANFSDHEIRIFFLEEEKEQPHKEYGDNVFLTRFSGKVGKVQWLTSHYLIFSVDDMIKIMEIDDRDHINIVDLASLKDHKIHYDRLSGKLYVLSNENLFVSKRII